MRHLVAIFGMIFVLGPIAVWAFSLTPLGRAMADRLRGRSSGSDEALLEVQDEMERLHDHLISQDQRLEELHDRLDFTERLLAEVPRAAEESEKVATPV